MRTGCCFSLGTAGLGRVVGQAVMLLVKLCRAKLDMSCRCISWALGLSRPRDDGGGVEQNLGVVRCAANHLCAYR
jgi:hypothetical protein